LSTEYEGKVVGKVDVDANQEFAAKTVWEIPTVWFFITVK
jgi:thioredoxin-like negative regulator of GroEL